MLDKLRAPLPDSDIKWRPGATNADKSKALALPYFDARAVMDRLDEAVGPANWQDSYRSGADGGVICRLELRIDGEWIAKEDGAENTDIEAVKGGISEALRRAAVKWGIGRYLYDAPPIWWPCEPAGKSVRLKGTPSLNVKAPNVNTETGEIADPEHEAQVMVYREFFAQCKGLGIGMRAICEALGHSPSGAEDAADFLANQGAAGLAKWLAVNPDLNWTNLVSRLADKKAAAK